VLSLYSSEVSTVALKIILPTSTRQMSDA